MRLFDAVLALALSGCAVAPKSNPGSTPPVDVFVGGEGGHAVYRIPAATRLRDGRLLAFAEARASQADIGRNAIVMRRSSDGGHAWDAMREVAAIDGRSLNNPCVVEVTRGARAGRTVLVFQSYPAGAHEGEVPAGIDGPETCHAHVIASDDGGERWSAPRDITRAVKRPPPVSTLASGPGAGIELRSGPHAGRLVVPFNEGPYGDWRVFMAVSDDAGESWRMGETAPEGGRRLVVTGPDDTARRRNGTAWVSDDGGASWPARVPFHAGEFAYSVPVALADGRLGVLYEADGCRRIAFAAVPLPVPGAAVR